MKVVNERSEIIKELYAPYRINFPRRRIEIRGIDDTLEIDLADMSKLKNFNNRYSFILVATNPFTKMLYTRKITSKKPEAVVPAMISILDQTKLKFKNLFSDHGSEFYNALFKKKVVDAYKLNHYSTRSKIKCAHVERKIKHLKQELYKSMDLKGTQRWINLLDDVTKKINNMPHSRYKFIPSKINKKNAKEIYDNFYSKPREISKKCDLRVGDKVRISELPKIFRRGFTPYWSPAIYEISNINYKLPHTFLLIDHKKNPLKRSYYRQELLKTKFPETWLIERIVKTSGQKCLVKWFGLDAEENTWVKKKDIFDREK